MKEQLLAFSHRFDILNSKALFSGGAIITWLATGKDTGGHFSLFEAKGIPGMEPPAHVHINEDESYYLLEGEMRFKIGDHEMVGKPGDFVFLPRNIRHEFKVLSPQFRCLVGIYPSGLENYFDVLMMPYQSSEIPPLATTPPTAEQMEMMQKLDQQYGLTYFFE